MSFWVFLAVAVGSLVVGGFLAAGGMGGIARYSAPMLTLPAAERRRRAMKSFGVVATLWMSVCGALELAGVPASSSAEAIALTATGVVTALTIFGLAAACEYLVQRRGIALVSAVAMLAAVLRVVPLSVAAAVSVCWRAMRQLLVIMPSPRRRLSDVNLTARLLPIPRFCPVRG